MIKKSRTSCLRPRCTMSSLMFIFRNGFSRSFHSANSSGNLRMVVQDTWPEVWLGPFHALFCAGFQQQTKPSHSCRSIHTSARNRRAKISTVRNRKIEDKIKILSSQIGKKKQPRVQVWRNITVEELSKRLAKDPETVIDATQSYVPGGDVYHEQKSVINDLQVVSKICKLFGKTPEFVKSPEDISQGVDVDNDVYPRPPPDKDVLVKRAPVVTIMGHVDHGKTTLLDSLRNSNVVASEFGGITQHIGAFSVTLNEKEKVTFIDTPGHAAFTSMRSRGAHATDIVVLVVAADDGVMEQTLESIRMAEEANVPIIVAINKVDKPRADIKRVEEMLAQVGVNTESMNGDVQAIPISALNGTNLDTLIQAILVQAEMMDLKADPTGFVEGIILETRQDPHRGKLASAIIQRGTLRKGAVLVAGHAHAKIRLMFDEEGKQLTEAPPSTPVQMMGWRELPSPGDLMLEVESEKRANQVLLYREKQKESQKMTADAEIYLKKNLLEREKHLEERKKALEQGILRVRQKREKLVEDTSPRVSVIIKGDVDGSVEAILDVLETYQSEDVKLDIVHYGVGEPTETDLEMAEVFNAILYCFNVTSSQKLKSKANAKGISVRSLNVIYHLIDDLKKEISGKLPFDDEEVVMGEADVLQQFEFTEKKMRTVIVGLRVKRGEFAVCEKAKLIRNGEILHDGTIVSMRHLKNDVKSLSSGTEGGIVLDCPVDVKQGDVVVCYKIIPKQRQTDWDPGF